MKRTPILFVSSVLLAVLVVAGALPAAAWAIPSSIPIDQTWVANGSVWASAVGPDGTVYIGGTFTYVGPRTGCGVALDPSSGLRDTSFPLVDGPVYAAVSDGAGGYYIGGEFTVTSGATTRSRLAHILSDGTLATAFDASPSATVYALAVSGSTVYAGGDFTTIGGQSRSRIAALSATTGAASAWSGDADGPIFALAVSGTTLYAGGAFTHIGGQDRNRIAALSTTVDIDPATPWNPDADASVRALLVSGSTVYAGGDFGTIGGQYRSYIAALQASNGNATSWDPQADGSVRALALSGSTVYAGGEFYAIGGANRTFVGALDAGSGLATSWQADADSPVHTLVVSGSTIYAGGDFTGIRGQSRRGIAALDTTSGAVAAWNPCAGGSVYALAVSGSTVYAGGSFASVNGVKRNRIAALDPATGAATAWDPDSTGNVYALAVSGSTVYAGGGFNTIGGQTRYRIAGLDTTTGLATSFDPNSSGTVYALAVSEDTVYAGGSFATIGGASRANIAALMDTTGAATSWNPGANSGVRALAVLGSNVYAGGDFATIGGGAARNRIAAISETTGLATSWDPNSNNAVMALAVSEGIIYAGGSFTNIGGQPRSRIAAIDESTGTARSWNPNADNQVYTLAVSGSTVYAGGSFLTIGGASRSYVAGLDASSGSATSWNPGANGAARSFAFSGSAVYVGGQFGRISEQLRPGFAGFSLVPTGTMSINGGATYTTTTSVTINNTVDRATKMRFRDAGGSWSSWEDYSATKSWTLPSGDGTKTVEAQYCDPPADALALSDSIELDTAPPDGDFTINEDTGFVNSRVVTLHPTASDAHGPVELQVRNAGASWPGVWQSLTADVSWTLTLFEGEKTVEMRFRDAYGNMSDAVSQTVVLESTPPSGWITIADGAYAISTHSTTVETWASDLNGGVVMRLRNGGEAWPGSWVAAGGTVPVSLPSGEGTKIVQAQFKDLAGNITLVQDEVIVDTIAPSGSMSIAGGDPYTVTPDVTVSLSASDATKVDAFRLRQDGGSWSDWQDMVESQPVVLTGVDGDKTLEVQYRDIAGNTSDVVPDSIVLDRVAPVTADNTASGAWHDGPFTLHLTPSDATSGMSGGQAKTEYSSDGGTTWVTGLSRTYGVWKRAGGSGTYAMLVRSTDAAGNAETAHAVSVRIDAVVPYTTDDAPAGAHNHDVTVHFTAGDSLSGVAETWYRLDDGPWTLGSSVTVTAAGNDGVHWIAYYSIDNVGNTETREHVCSVTIDNGGGGSLAPAVTPPPTPTASASRPASKMVKRHPPLRHQGR